MAKAAPRISVIERRLASVNIFHASEAPVRLKDPAWTVRWENAKISATHMQTVIQRLGWEYVHPDELDGDVSEIGATITDGKIVRGERGEEKLVKMRLTDYRSIQKRKDRDNRLNTFGKQAIKAAVVAGVEAAHGDEAAAFVSERVNTIRVTDSRAPEA
jgi:hypothetical protein